MNARPECIACLFRQALNTARLATDNREQQLEILRRVAAAVGQSDLHQSPALLCKPAYTVTSEVTGVADPYAAQKRQTNATALALVEELRGKIEQAADPLDAALHVAVAGNIIDLGLEHAFDIEKDVLHLLHQPFAVNAIGDFRRELTPGRRVLYLGDNAGEIVLDRLLVERLLAMGMQVVFTVKSGPVINDATMEDAEVAGLTGLVTVIATGSDDIGVSWERCSDEFRAAVSAADLILAKGHGNFETCDDRPENFYFLLKTKCPVVAEAAGSRLGDLVFLHHPSR